MTISTVTTDTQAADTCDVTGEIKTFYAVGLYWVFWRTTSPSRLPPTR